MLTYEVKRNTSNTKTDKHRGLKNWKFFDLGVPSMEKMCPNSNSLDKYLLTVYAVHWTASAILANVLSWSVCNKVFVSNFGANSPTLEQCWLPQDINPYTSTLKVKPCAKYVKYICFSFRVLSKAFHKITCFEAPLILFSQGVTLNC